MKQLQLVNVLNRENLALSLDRHHNRRMTLRHKTSRMMSRTRTQTNIFLFLYVGVIAKPRVLATHRKSAYGRV